MPVKQSGPGSISVSSNGKKGAATAAPNPDVIVNELENVVEAPKDEYTCASGLKFKIKKVSSLLISEAGRKIKDPEVPMAFIEEKGREEENPNDPNYVIAKQEVDWQRTIITINATIAFGTDVLGDLPEGMEHWEGTDWSEQLEELLGVEIPARGRGRYAAWIKYYAVPDHQEILDMQMAVARFSGRVPEVDVQEAEDSFRDNEERDSAEGIST